MKTLFTEEFTRVFAAPMALAFVSLIGLLAALLGDGAWDAVSWCALSAPIGVIARFVLRS
jgi:hypothetical protein